MVDSGWTTARAAYSVLKMTPNHRTIPESIRSYTPPEAPVCLWLTGLPAAGKTTLSEALAKVFTESGLSVELLDGDRIRAALSPQLGYSRADRHSNVVRVAHLAVEALSHRDVVIVALVSPYGDARAEARGIVEEFGTFVEVHVDASPETCIARDPKGLYAKALAGEIADFTGVDGSYERPRAPEVHVDTNRLSVDEAIDLILTEVRVLVTSGEQETSHRAADAPAPAPLARAGLR